MVTPELVTALTGLWLARAALVGLNTALLYSLDQGSLDPRSAQLRPIAVESYRSVELRSMVMHKSAVRGFGDGTTVEVLVLQVRRVYLVAKRVLNRLEVRR